MGFFGEKTSRLRTAGIGLAVGCILLLVFALAMPWYYDSYQEKNSNGDVTCTTLYLTGWFQQYCTQHGDGCSSYSCDGYPLNWRDKCNNPTNGSNQTQCDLIQWYNVGFALTLVSLALACLVAVISMITGTHSSMIRSIASLFSTIFVIAAVIAWSVGVSKVWSNDSPYSGQCVLIPGKTTTDCNGFWFSGGNFSHGPAGWYIAIIAALLNGNSFLRSLSAG